MNESKQDQKVHCHTVRPRRWCAAPAAQERGARRRIYTGDQRRGAPTYLFYEAHDAVPCLRNALKLVQRPK
ncbi:hypothetical protein HAX54_051288, partial [Datura stramonium]|nr:hypothetical protein [Datura stramonium]